MTVDPQALLERPQSRPTVDPAALQPHPLALLVPEMSEDDYADLVEDIDTRGLLEPVVLFENRILDGRHRNRACRETGRPADFTEYTGSDPMGYVTALNLHQRHLTASQKAVIALEVEKVYAEQAKTNMVQGGRVSQDRETLTVKPVHAAKEAGKAVGVSYPYVSEAKRVAKDAPDLLPQVSAGTMTLPEASRDLRRRKEPAVVAEPTPPIPPTEGQPRTWQEVVAHRHDKLTTKERNRLTMEEIGDREQAREIRNSLAAVVTAVEMAEPNLSDDDHVWNVYSKVDPLDRAACLAELHKAQKTIKSIIRALRKSGGAS